MEMRHLIHWTHLSGEMYSTYNERHLYIFTVGLKRPKINIQEYQETQDYFENVVHVCFGCPNTS